jgi:Leucine-rich repeat (LRR) protein
MNPARSYGVERQNPKNDLNNPSQGSDNPEELDPSNPSASDTVNEFVTINGEKYHKDNTTTLHSMHGNISNIDALADLKNLTKLNLLNNQIVNIDALGNLKNLKVLTLTRNSIEKIHALGNLKNLEILNLSSNQIKDITSLETLNELKTLSLGSNQIGDITPLGSLEKLQLLILSHNQITDIAPLAGLTNVRSLNLTGNKITNIDALKDLKKLTSLDLTGNNIPNDDASRSVIQTLRQNNPSIEIKGVYHIRQVSKGIINQKAVMKEQEGSNDSSTVTINGENYSKDSTTKLNLRGKKITDTSSLATLTKLRELDLRDNQIKEIGHLKNLANLVVLNLDSNDIEKIDGLADLTNLKSLSIHSNGIEKIDSLANLTKLTELDLYNNTITNIDGLADLTNLQYLNLQSNGIQNIDALKGLTNLEYLNLNSNGIEKIDGLADLTNLQSLSIHSNSIEKIDSLANLTKLEELDLYNNTITNIDALKDLTNLQYLNLQSNGIQNIDALKGLTNLQYLNLQSNRIEKIDSLEDLKNLQVLDLSNNPKISINDRARLFIKLTKHNPNINILFSFNAAARNEFFKTLKQQKRINELEDCLSKISNWKDFLSDQGILIEDFNGKTYDEKIKIMNDFQAKHNNQALETLLNPIDQHVEEEKNWASFILVKGVQEVKEITFNSQSNDFAKRSTLWLNEKTKGTQSFNDVITEILGAINNDKKLDENTKNVAQFALLGEYDPQYSELFGIDASQYNLKIKDFKIDSNWGGVFGQQNITMSGTDSDLKDVVVRLWELCQQEPDPFKKKVLIDSFITGLSNMYDQDGLHCRDRFQDVILAVLSNIDEAPKYAKGVTLFQLFEPLEKRRLAEYNELPQDHPIKLLYEKLTQSSPRGEKEKDPLYPWVPLNNVQKFNALNKEEKDRLDRYRKDYIDDALFAAYLHKEIEKGLTNGEVEAITNYINQLIVADFL